VHRIHVPWRLEVGEVTVGGEEAYHAARVKRLEAGEGVELLDGAGRVASATVGAIVKRGREWEMALRVGDVRVAERVHPRVDVLGAAPKGERLERMVESLSQAGAVSWSPLAAARSVVEPRAGKLGRLGRVAAESGKQCGRAWFMEIGEEVELATALRRVRVVVADASGDAYRRTGSPEISLLIGPEGGWTVPELEASRRAGAMVARFGPHAMRIETAACVAVGVILNVENG